MTDVVISLLQAPFQEVVSAICCELVNKISPPETTQEERERNAKIERAFGDSHEALLLRMEKIIAEQLGSACDASSFQDIKRKVGEGVADLLECIEYLEKILMQLNDGSGRSSYSEFVKAVKSRDPKMEAYAVYKWATDPSSAKAVSSGWLNVLSVPDIPGSSFENASNLLLLI